MNGQCEVFCAGNAVADILARPVDHLEPPGTSQRLEDVAFGPGGNAVNTAIALARLGVSVRVAAALGEDRFGQFLRERVCSEGLDDSGLVILAGSKTSTSIVLVQASGERRFLHLRGASTHFSEEHLKWELAKGARFFHYASAFALPAFDGPPLVRTLRRAREAGCETSVNVCWDLQGRWLSLLEPALAWIDFMFPNLEEGRKLTGESEPEAIAQRLRAGGVKTVVVKLGANGCYVESPDAAFNSPGFLVQAIDSTGAGDCFAAGFLAALCRGRNLTEAARFANAAGALATLGLGGADSAPTRAKVLAFLAKLVTRGDIER